MSPKRLVLLCSLPAVITGCAEFHGSQPPAPVFDGHADIYIQPEPSARQQEPKRIQQPVPVLKTEPIRESARVPEVIQMPPEVPPVDEFSAPESSPPSELSEPAESLAPAEADQPVTPAQPFNTGEPIKPPEPVEVLQPLEPLQSLGTVKPAVGALAMSADQSHSSGNLDAAVATIERAIRIEPRNPALYYKLAELRLKQSKPRLAEDLAKKSALLASNNPALKKQSWLLIGNARVMQKDYAGAKAARAKAAQF